MATFAAAAPPMPSPSDADYGASGFVTPAGMRPIGSPGVMPAMYPSRPGMPRPGMPGPGMPGPGMPMGGVQQAGGMGMMGPGRPVMPAGFMGGGPSCDCNGYGCNRCSGGAIGTGSIMQSMHGCDDCAGGGCAPAGGGCGSCLGGCGNGCLGNCGSNCLGGCLGGCLGKLGIGQGGIANCLYRMLPYSEGGQCAQRWFDLSSETIFLGRNGNGGSGGTISTFGIAGPEALSVSDADLDELEAGIRLTGSILLGVGGNIEVTYMGSNRWEGAAAVNSPVDPITGVPTANLYSFISEFGTSPLGGFDDSDRSTRHAVTGEANFHSGEVNYRRRTVLPSCQFQGSWLFGLRYLRLDDSLTFSANGLVNNGGAISTPRFLDLTTETKNDLFGVQVGGDFWWNVMAGVNLGCELKLGLLDNEVDRAVFATGNSLGPGATPGTRSASLGASETTGMLEFNTALVYRLSHSWAFRTSYYLLAIDEVAGGFDSSVSNALLQTPQQTSNQHITYGSMVLTGFTFGTEYTW